MPLASSYCRQLNMPHCLLGTLLLQRVTSGTCLQMRLCLVCVWGGAWHDVGRTVCRMFHSQHAAELLSHIHHAQDHCEPANQLLLQTILRPTPRGSHGCSDQVTSAHCTHYIAAMSPEGHAGQESITTATVLLPALLLAQPAGHENFGAATVP
jgi:hypothetical protein